MIDQRLTDELERFARAVTDRLGLLFEESKAGFLAEVLQRRLDALKQPAETYLRRLEKSPDEELAALATELTVGETYFFRNHEQFDALIQAALPDRMKARSAVKSLNILSAACASGDEAYSIAAAVREAVNEPGWRVSIRAVDVNPAALAKARRARYSSWAMRETPAAMRTKWFRADGRDFTIDPALKEAVSFEEANLATEANPSLWPPEAYDVVFCRNALMYFSPDQARATIARIAGSLAPGGYLFLGHAETLRGLSDDFHLHHTHGAFYYSRKAGLIPSRRKVLEACGSPGPALMPAMLASASSAVTGDSWVEAIRLASERVDTLVTRRQKAVPPPKAAPAVTPAPAAIQARRADTGAALDLMREERFTEALARVRDLGAPDGDLDTLLLEAMLLAHSGDYKTAESVCRRLLAADELNAGAHYALALCRESVGDRKGAAEHDRVAVYLDPGFAMPRLHLGLMARQAGDKATGRRELSQAVLLLQREDASRLLLFGGGFHRDALIALCQSALKACGGRS